jgi:CelD/BcsL family acetyltransferase involved in cellulose biosynthesis
MTPATVAEVDPLADGRWDAYVRAHPRAGAYHLAAWAAILRGAYRARPRYLAATGEDGALRGVLPLTYRRGLMTGRRLRSLPAVPAAGPLGDTRADELALLEAACALGDGDVRVLAVNTRAEGYARELPGLGVIEMPPAWVLELPGDAEELRARWKRSSNVARSVRKIEAGPLIFREASSEADLRAFYRLYLATMRKHGALPRSLRQLLLARRHLQPSGVFRLFLVEHAGMPVSGGVFHCFGGTVELLYNASDQRTLDLRPNHALYWGVARWAIERGAHAFDFGFAWTDSALGAFKAQWGARPVPEYCYVSPAGAAGLPTPPGEEGPPGRLRRVGGAALRRAPLALTRAAGVLGYRYA